MLDVIDIREETIGFPMNDGEAELVLLPRPTVTVLYNHRGGQATIAEGSPEFVCKLLAKAGIRAVVREGSMFDE
jgi:hypothetical protein